MGVLSLRAGGRRASPRCLVFSLWHLSRGGVVEVSRLLLQRCDQAGQSLLWLSRLVRLGGCVCVQRWRELQLAAAGSLLGLAVSPRGDLSCLL